ncbi:MAG: 50S ribosomal protein L29 [Minisyncoccia bacterium]
MKKKEQINHFLQMSEEELINLLKEQKTKLANLIFNLKLGKIKNTKEILKLKKEIARIKTVLKNKFNLKY